MRTRPLLLFSAALALTGMSASPALAGFLYEDGPPNGYAAHPDGYLACVNCHTGTPLNGGSGMLAIEAPAEYQAGQTYSIRVTLQDPGQSRWGFELTALSEDERPAGTLSSTSGQTQVHADSFGRQYAKHTKQGTQVGSSSATWTFDWTAPASGTDPVFFYAAGNAANNDGKTSGDRIYTAASASAKVGTNAEATLVLQPDGRDAQRGSNWIVRARVRNHQASSSSILLASRVLLSTGGTYPATGFLLPPITVSLPAQGNVETEMIHLVPATTPLLTATYEGLVGHAPSTLVDSFRYPFSVLP